jgi:hypothetical protein
LVLSKFNDNKLLINHTFTCSKNIDSIFFYIYGVRVTTTTTTNNNNNNTCVGKNNGLRALGKSFMYQRASRGPGDSVFDPIPIRKSMEIQYFSVY